MAGMSSCASMDCAKNNGERHSKASAAKAGVPMEPRAQLDSKQKCCEGAPPAAIRSIAMRVASME